MFSRLFAKRDKKQTPFRQRPQPWMIERLESRTLLSATSGVTMQTNLQVIAAATSAADIAGYTPSQIRQAYGFTNVKFPNSNVAADGAGQTIAIIDAYNDPNIASDLSVFDKQFGLSAPPSFKVVNQSGGSSLPKTDSGWAGEIALDVEWAHAIAPAANILLVEASSADVSSLMTAVDYARHAVGVSVISMSWGGSEFFSWGGGESQSQLTYDPIFTTPSGHSGVTFVAAAGDSGVSNGVEWPASSPNVISVGGTTLTLDSSGNYVSESSWNGTSGGYSVIENTPAYQSSVTTSSTRAVPDVSYAGDPNTGFAVYDSLPDQGYVGWQEVGGTSAGAPQWAALIAIADQGRTLAGSGTLDGASQTLPLLYSLYSAPGTTGYSTYSSDFHDVIDSTGGGFGGRWHWRWGGWGGQSSQATSGYDAITGLGSPNAAAIIDALIGSSTGSSSGSGSSSSSGSSSGSTSSLATQAASPLAVAFTSSTPISVVGGSSDRLKLLLTNLQATKFTGSATITIYASTDQTVSVDDAAIATLSLKTLSLHAGGSKSIHVKFDYPTTLPDGSYYLIASVQANPVSLLTSATSTQVAPATAVSTTQVAIAAPKVDLAVSSPSGQAVKVTPGKGASVTITLENLGNVVALGNVTVSLYASTDETLDSSDTMLATRAVRIRLRPGRAKTLRIHFVAPLDQMGGTYNVLASISSVTNPLDTNSSNDVVAIPTIAA